MTKNFTYRLSRYSGITEGHHPYGTEGHHPYGREHIEAEDKIAALKKIIKENTYGGLVYCVIVEDQTVRPKDPNPARYLSAAAVIDLKVAELQAKEIKKYGDLVVPVYRFNIPASARIEILRDGSWVSVEEFRYHGFRGILGLRKWVPLEERVKAA